MSQTLNQSCHKLSNNHVITFQLIFTQATKLYHVKKPTEIMSQTTKLSYKKISQQSCHKVPKNYIAKPSNSHVTNYQKDVNNVCISTINTKAHILTNYNIIKKEKTTNKKICHRQLTYAIKSPPRH